jgi:hypothetical protein
MEAGLLKRPPVATVDQNGDELAKTSTSNHLFKMVSGLLRRPPVAIVD